MDLNGPIPIPLAMPSSSGHESEDQVSFPDAKYDKYSTIKSTSSAASSRSRPSSLNPQWYDNHFAGKEGRDVSVSPVTSIGGGASDLNSGYRNRQQVPSTIAPHTPALNIVAPTPRRHLIETSESSHWLNLGLGGGLEHAGGVSPFTGAGEPPSPISPTGSLYSAMPDSRTASPVGYSHSGASAPMRQRTSSSRSKRNPSVASTGAIGQGPAPGFGALYQAEQQRSTLRKRQLSSASIGSNFTVATAPTSTSGLHRARAQHAGGDEQQAGGKRLIRWMHKNGMKNWVVPLSIGFATLVKLCLGMGSYSGESTPPMFGDYEAQRHWLEITTHLPFREWYTYDLQYWGLDYPPLTAYVSWVCGLIAHSLNPAWVALDASRGIETPGSKLFMRLSVVVLDLLVYVPALVLFVKTWLGTRSHRTQEHALLVLLLQPGLLLVDHGHFQYNSVMLGFTLVALSLFTRGRDLGAAIAFVMSLGFKQMALYYAPAVGSYLLAKCLWLGWARGARLFIRLGATTVLAFTLLFAPFFLPPFAPSFAHVLHPITRIFPFGRGLFEDKVANFWCASNVVVKWTRLTIAAAGGDEEKARGWLVKLSTLLTAVGFTPSVIGLLRAGWVTMPSGSNSQKQEEQRDGEEEKTLPGFIALLPYALLTSSMSFFLFSFQVHEKTILVPLLPLTLLMAAAQPGSSLHCWGALGNNIAIFSMWPLLKRDGQGIACLATLLLWNMVVGYNPLKRTGEKKVVVKENVTKTSSLWSLPFVQLVSLAVYPAAIALVLLEMVVTPPRRYPDIIPVLNVLISTPVFVLIWLWSIKCGIEVGWALGGWSSGSHHKLPEKLPVEGSNSKGHEDGHGPSLD